MLNSRHEKQREKIKPRYRSLRCEQMTDEDVRATIDLFGKNYGVWVASEDPNHIPGNNIKMPFMRKAIVDKPDRYIAMAYDNERLIGYAYYMRRKTPAGNMVTWILQLVVDKEYRGNDIGTKIMHAIWGMSDSWAWGLYTSNPFTIKCLQDATMRKVKGNVIEQHLDELKTVSYDLLPDTNWIDTYDKGIVDTRFPIDFSDAVEKFRERFPNEKFDLSADLKIGHEWFAFVFSDQKPKPTTQQVQKYLDFSEEITKDAYAKMDMESQAWASHADKEVDFIIQETNHPQTVLDIGCGRGRHSIEFSDRGIDTTGIDYVEVPNKVKARENEVLRFECVDARNVILGRKFDVAIALYDVIGSYPDEHDNFEILKTAYKHLNPNGILVISVMNMELTKEECSKNKNIVTGVRKKKNILKLITLKGSDTMQRTGQVFDGKHIVLDSETGECFRKELFFCEDSLPIEYVVVDRRYSIKGIRKLVRAAGFDVEKCYCVQAGRFNKELQANNPKAKEILVIARKGTWLQKMFTSHDIRECWL